MGKAIDLNGLSRFLDNLKSFFVWRKANDFNSVKTYSSNYVGSSSEYSVAEGILTTAGTNGNYCHAEGLSTEASANYSHAEGSAGSRALGASSHSEECSVASGECSHAEGFLTSAVSHYSHSEGYYTKASGLSSHAEGYRTEVTANYSHAEGYQTKAASGASSTSGYIHAEGYGTLVYGSRYCHVGGFASSGTGDNSFIHGVGLSGTTAGQFIFGKYNQVLGSNYIGVFGWGTASTRKTVAYCSTAGTWGTYSDIRYKDDIEDISENVLNAMDEISFREFTFKNEKAENPKKSAAKHYGVIAQEVISALTNNGLDYKNTSLVGGSEETKYDVAYISLLVAKCASYERRFKKMQETIEYLKPIVESLEEKS